eukprot:TRINITY_DN42684_c0_g1_i1.p1 TRINITY_DN42684_c0_g1~~TRINITY_DN42684_c0_g1_i1.p1  ORF type:complete len:990 (+),score=193.92 TRINITY_DN42684_c0_g1_i1:91-3060(+)
MRDAWREGYNAKDNTWLGTPSGRTWRGGSNRSCGSYACPQVSSPWPSDCQEATAASTPSTGSKGGWGSAAWRTECNDAKAQLMAMLHVEGGHGLSPDALRALQEALKQRPAQLPVAPLPAAGLDRALLDRLRIVFEKDHWDDEFMSGKQWISEWLRDGMKWAEEAWSQPPGQEQQAAASVSWCKSCWRRYSETSHFDTKEHVKKLKHWLWRYGHRPDEGIFVSGGRELLQRKVAGGTCQDHSLESRLDYREKGACEVAPRMAVPAVETAAACERTAAAPQPQGPSSSGSKKGTRASPVEILACAERERASPVAQAKEQLLRFRDSLSERQRQEILERIGLRVASDAQALADLKPVFGEETFAQMCKVQDAAWLWKEPTFSWLAGFYWHPDSTSLQQGGHPHSEYFCHLCEAECHDEATWQTHLTTRRHAESLQRWVHKLGSVPTPTHCSRCPLGGSGKQHFVGGSTSHVVSDEQGACSLLMAESGRPPLDLCCEEWDTSSESGGVRKEAEKHEDEEDVGETARIPQGFLKLYRPPPSRRPAALSYAAFTLRLIGPREPQEVVVASGKLRIGQRIGPKKDRHRQRWSSHFQRPLPSEGNTGLWRSLAIPLRQHLPSSADGSGPSALASGSWQEFIVLARWSNSGTEEFEELGKLHLQVCEPGQVLVSDLQFTATTQGGRNGWTSSPGNLQQMGAVRHVPVQKFTGAGQIEAFGGIEALRGNQRAFQLCTDEVLIAFLLYLPERTAGSSSSLLQPFCESLPQPCEGSSSTAPVLVFLHGDVERGVQSWLQPGIPSWASQFGPAELCDSQKAQAAAHPARSFVVVTPCCPEDFWWFRHRAVHDSTSYVPGMVAWFLHLFSWLREDLGVAHSANSANGGIRLVGQSMGAYGVLELARAIPNQVAAVAALAPCFDGFRLNWLADRLRGVPLWVMIARWDSMCAFEEAASLVLKLRDRRARCARLSSFQLKDHNDACKCLKASWLYQWLLNPLHR